MTRLRKALPILILACAALTALPLAAQPPDCSFTFTFTGAATQTAVSNLSQNTPCVNWRLTLSTTGTLSATVTFYTSPDASTWTAVPNTICSSIVQPPCVLQGANPIVGTQGMLYAASYGSYVQVIVTSPSGAGTGTVRGYGAKGATAGALPGGSGGGGTPGGSPGQVQYNNSGAFGGQSSIFSGGTLLQQAVECAHGTVAYTTVAAAGAVTSTEITIQTGMTGNDVYDQILVNASTPFTFSSGTSPTVSMGRPGATTDYEMTGTLVPIDSTVPWTARPAPPQLTTTYSIVLNFAMTTGNVNALTAGALDWRICGYVAQ